MLRALALLPWLAAVGLTFAALRRGLTPGVRLAMDFSLALYTVTFFAGVAALFVGQAELVDAYFGGSLPAPSGTPYGALLLLVSLPFLVLPAVARLLPQATRCASIAVTPPAALISRAASLVGVGVTLGLVWSQTGQLLPTLTGNALSQLGETSGLTELYERRRDAFEGLSAAQSGLLYGTLPACGALLLFTPGPLLGITRLAGLAVVALAILVNAGLFQIAPLLAFGLMLMLCALVRLQGRIRWKYFALAGVAAVAVFGLYESLKAQEGSASSPVNQLALRLPIALPYLWQFSNESPADLAASDSVPHDLAEFMFPQLRGAERFVAMPQPGFVLAFFQLGASAALAVLVIISLITTIGGRALDRYRRSQDPQRSALVAIVLAPALYYSFQVQLLDVFVSSYSILWPALPVLAVVATQALLRAVLPRRANFTTSPTR